MCFVASGGSEPNFEDMIVLIVKNLLRVVARDKRLVSFAVEPINHPILCKTVSEIHVRG